METYTIYADRIEEVKKQLDKLAKKAARYSVPFAYSIGEEHPETVQVRDVDPVTQTIYTVNTFTVAAVDVNIECDGFIKANGWSIRARVEHGQGGNIVTGIGPKPVNPDWYKAPAHCEHCKTNRFRSITYFCENESGAIRQVGRTCLHDYTGISPATAAMWAEVRDILCSDMDCTTREWVEQGHSQMYSTEMILAHACDSIRERGYVKSSDPGSTRDQVAEKIANYAEPTAEALEEAKSIMAWITSLDAVLRKEDEDRKAAWAKAKERAIADGYTEEGFDDYTSYVSSKYICSSDYASKVGDLERNCIPLALSGYAKIKHIGRLAYMPIAYKRHLEKKARDEKRETERLEAAAASSYVGDVGQRITVKMATANLVTSWESTYGMTFLYKFTDEQGNIYIWYASRGIETRDGMTLKATVKSHNERDGVKQTVITRCKAA